MNAQLFMHVSSASRTAGDAVLRLWQAAERHPRITGAVIFIVSLVMFLCYYSLEPVLSRDSLLYIDRVGQTAKNGWFTSRADQQFPSLLVVLAAKLVRMGIPAVPAGLIVNFCAAASLPVLAYAIAGRIFRNFGIAVLSGVLMLLHPEIRVIAVAVQRDAPGLALQLLAGYLLIRAAGTGRPGLMFWSGMSLAGSINFRYENLEFVILLPALFIAWRFFGEKTPSGGPIPKNGHLRGTLQPIVLWIAGLIVGLGLIAWFCRESDFFLPERLKAVYQRYSFLVKF